MKELYKKVNFLPNIPEELILTTDMIENQQNVCPTGNIKPDGKSIFRVYDASPEIYDLIVPCFDQKVAVRWQLITADLPIHYDWGTSSEKYLYLIHKGGKNVVTKFWTEKENDPVLGGSFEQEDRELVMTISEEEKSWFVLNVKKPHNVSNIESARLALIVRPVEEII